MTVRTARIVVEDDGGNVLARYTGVPFDAVERVVRFLGWFLGPASIAAQIKRRVVEALESVEAANAVHVQKRRRRG